MRSNNGAKGAGRDDVGRTGGMDGLDHRIGLLLGRLLWLPSCALMVTEGVVRRCLRGVGLMERDFLEELEELERQKEEQAKAARDDAPVSDCDRLDAGDAGMVGLALVEHGRAHGGRASGSRHHDKGEGGL